MKKTKTPAPRTLLDDIADAGAELSGAAIAKAIGMATTVLTDAKYYRVFVEAVAAADLVATFAMRLAEKGDSEAEEWYSLDLQGLRDRLQMWADQGNTSCSKILAALTKFEPLAVDVMDPLWRLVRDFVRPAGKVRTYGDLSQLLRTLEGKGLVARIHGQYPKNAIALGGEHGSSGYVPTAGNLLATTGWTYIMEARGVAEKAAEERREKLAELEHAATGLTADQAKAGKEGSLFFRCGMNGGAVLKVKTIQGKGVHICIIQAIGIRGLRTPTTWVPWNLAERSWPDRELFRAFIAWKNA